jgi:hypothetical protein
VRDSGCHEGLLSYTVRAIFPPLFLPVCPRPWPRFLIITAWKVGGWRFVKVDLLAWLRGRSRWADQRLDHFEGGAVLYPLTPLTGCQGRFSIIPLASPADQTQGRAAGPEHGEGQSFIMVAAWLRPPLSLSTSPVLRSPTGAALPVIHPRQPGSKGARAPVRPNPETGTPPPVHIILYPPFTPNRFFPNGGFANHPTLFES